jgi:VIT1/CCC1 family predicted Fe2+/Mn2+ transporter
MFVAQYAELRARLSRAACELNMPSGSHLLKSDLGQQVVQRSMAAALTASASSFIGASVPLAVAALTPSAAWTGLVVSLMLLGGLGWALASLVGGIRLRWTVVLVACGAIVAAIGSQLDVT